MAKLTPKQELFAKEYLIDLNATQSAIRAGYSEKTAAEQGARLLINVKVKQAISEAKSARQERTHIDQDYVIKTIVDTIERCKQAVMVTDRSGDPVLVETPMGELAPVYKFDATNILKGAELLGRHLVMFTDKVESKSSIEISSISDLMDELADESQS